MSMRWPGMLERQVIGRPVMGRITRPHEDATVWHVGAPGDQSLGDPRTDVMLPDTLRLCPGTSRLLPITDHRSPAPHHFPFTSNLPPLLDLEYNPAHARGRRSDCPRIPGGADRAPAVRLPRASPPRPSRAAGRGGARRALAGCRSPLHPPRPARPLGGAQPAW